MKKIYLLAVIAALVTAYATYRFATSLESKAKSQVSGSVNVVVAAVKIVENTVLEENMVEIKQISKELTGEGFVKSPSEVVGKITKYPLAPGEPLYTERLSLAGGDNPDRLAYEVPAGYRAVSVSVDEVSGVTNYLKKGDRIDVIAYFANEIEKGTKRIAFENLLVLRTGEEKSAGAKTESGSAKYESVTLAVTPEQAIELQYVIANAIIRLVLRPPVS